MNNDRNDRNDRIDQLLAEGARDYNQPGAAPRDEMWSRIDASRRARSAHGTAQSTVPLRQVRSSRPVWMWSSIGIAAALTVAGIALLALRLRAAAP